MQVRNKRKSNIQLFICLFGLIYNLSDCLHSSSPPLMPSLPTFNSKQFRVFVFATSSGKQYLIFFRCSYWGLRPLLLFHLEDMLYMSQIFRRQQFEVAKTGIRHFTSQIPGPVDLINPPSNEPPPAKSFLTNKPPGA